MVVLAGGGEDIQVVVLAGEVRIFRFGEDIQMAV